MKLTRPLSIIDIEATGLEITRDKIIDLAVLKIYPDGVQAPFSWRFDPGIPIPPESTAIHGITDEMVKGCPRFEKKAAQVLDVLDGSDYAGFNIVGFDLPMLYEEMWNAEQPWEPNGAAIVDAGVIMKRKEERSLEAALMFYCNEEHKHAHGAMADVYATFKVLERQTDGCGPMGLTEDAFEERARDKYGALAEMSVQELSDFCALDRDGGRRLDFIGTVVRNKDGVPVFGTKRNRGVPIENDYGYAEWILRSDFPRHTHRVLRAVLEEIDQKQREAVGQERLF